MTDLAVNLPDEDDKKKPSQATQLVKLAREQFQLISGDDGRAYAVARKGSSVARPLRGSQGLRKYLARAYADAHNGIAPSQTALADALNVLEGYASDTDPQPIYLRVAPYRGGVVVDLGTSDGRCVVVDQHTWVVLDRAPVYFRRTNLTAPMPTPAREGDLGPYLSLLNVDEDRRRALVGFLVSAFIPNMPHPILALFGEQGTAKSTATKLVMNLVDPSTAPLRSPPRDVPQWAVTANASWTVALDNVSDVPPWLSDLLCKAVTGDGHVNRALYSDDDVSVLRFRRVLAINGISIGALKGDLADRFMPVELDVITGARRRGDEEVMTTAAQHHAAAFGALLDLLVQVLAILPDIELDTKPRMADFACVLAAVDKVQGWTTLKTYLDAFDGLADTVVASDPFSNALREFADQLGGKVWEGSATELLHLVPQPDPKPRDWPKTPHAVAGKLKRAAPALRQLGYIAEPGSQDPISRRRNWRIGPPEGTEPTTKREGAEAPSEASEASKPQVTAPKLWDNEASELTAAASGAKLPEASAPQSFTTADQPKHGAPKLPKLPKPDSHLLSGATSTATCWVCREPLDPFHITQGNTAHPGCETS